MVVTKDSDYAGVAIPEKELLEARKRLKKIGIEKAEKFNVPEILPILKLQDICDELVQPHEEKIFG